MKPPLFIECSVCGREFGSKSIQIHEPQCLQKLRRTEIANQEDDETFAPTTTTTNKKARRKKKSGPVMAVRANTSTATPVMAEPGATIPHHHSAPNSFVLMATSSDRTSRFPNFHSKLNLPRIQNASKSGRPCTAVLDRPRILNPEYSQYDMSLTRIDFTGQPTSAPSSTTTTAAKMDENRNNNSRLQRQNTQVLDNAIKRHDFALPTVVDPSTYHYPQRSQKLSKPTTTLVDHQSKLLPPSSGNMVDAALGDPQKQARGDRGIMEESNGFITRDSGKRHHDAAHLVACCKSITTASTTTSSIFHCCRFPSSSDIVAATTTVFKSSWSKQQQVYFMSTEPVPILPPLVLTPKIVLSTKPDYPNFPDCDPPCDRSSPPIESLYAAPDFPFLSKLSHCDLEKPLRTCFHLDKIPRNSLEIYQDNFVTPSESSEFPPLQQQQQQQQTDGLHVAIIQDEKFPDLGESFNDATKRTEDVKQAEGLIIENIDQEITLANSYNTELRSEELFVVKSVVHGSGSESKSQNGLADVLATHPLADMSTPNWIGKPFMQQHTYYAAPVAASRETDTESEVYATPVAESHDEHDFDYSSTRESILGVMNELRQILERRESLHLKLNTTSAVNEATGPKEMLVSQSNPPAQVQEIPLSQVYEDIATGQTDTCDSLELPEEIAQLSVTNSDDIPSVGDECATITTTSKSSMRTVVSQSLSRGRLRRKRSREVTRQGAGSDADDESSAEHSDQRLPRRSLSIQRDKRLHRRYSNFKALHAMNNPKIKALNSMNLILFESEQDVQKTTQPEDEEDGMLLTENSDFLRFQLAAENEHEYPEDDEEFEAVLTEKMFRSPESRETPEVQSLLMDDGSIKDGDIISDKCSVESNPKPSPPPSSQIPPEAFEVNRVEVANSPFCPLSASDPSGDEIKETKTTFKPVLFSDDEIYEKFMAPHISDKSDSERGNIYHSGGENTSTERRRRHKRPATAGSISIADSVNIWEGAHMADRNYETSEEQDMSDYNGNEEFDRSARPPTRRGRDSRRSSQSGQSQQNSTTVDSKIQNLISNVNRVGQLHRERQYEAQQRPKTVPASPYATPLAFNAGSNDRPSTSLPHSEMTRKSKSVPKRKKRTNSKSAAPSTNSSVTSMVTNRRPGTSTSIRIGVGNRALTVRTSVADSLAIQDNLNHNNRQPFLSEDEPLELLFSFKKKQPKKRNQSPIGLVASVDKNANENKAEFYKQIDRHRRETLAEVHGSRKRVLANRQFTPVSTPPHSSGASTPRNSIKDESLKAKEVIRELKRQLNFKDTPDTSRQKSISAKLKKYTEDSSNRKRIPVPMSKRVTFSSPPSPYAAPFSGRSVKLRRKVPSKNAMGSRIKIYMQPSSKITATTPESILTVKTKKKGVLRMTNLGSEHEGCGMPDRNFEPPVEQVDPKKDKEEVAEKLDNMEAKRDKSRTKEFERRKRGKGGDGGRGNDNQRWSNASVMVPSRRSMQDDNGDEKFVNVKIIVRRKNKDGTYPPLEEIGHNFSSKWNYVVIDEEPLTAKSPNAYEAALENRAKAKIGTGNELKITTSDQSTVNSLDSEDAATRFLTCFVCGQTLNVREYFAHEEQCVKDIDEKNQFLAEEDKRELPPKPQGTITINHWNQFAHDAVRHKYITCPFCMMEFLPENQDDVELHRQICVDRPPPPPPEPRGIGPIEGCTIETALEVWGRVIPTSKELRHSNWRKGYERVEQYSRPASNRLKKYKRPKSERNKLI